METIKQFEIFLTERNIIQMPYGAVPLSFNNKDNTLQLSAIVNYSAKVEHRIFELVGSGSQPPPATKRRYVGAAQLSGITWHLFEIV